MGFQRPELPRVDRGVLKMSYPDLAISATARWQTLPVPLWPGEVVTTHVRGSIRYYHRTWTTAGSCGKTNHHVDSRAAGPDQDQGRVAYRWVDASTGSLLRPLGDAGEGSRSSLGLELEWPLHDARLAVATVDAVHHDPSDNDGSYELAVAVDSTKRSDHCFAYLDRITGQLGGAEKASLDPTHVARGALRWFTPRAVLDGATHNGLVARLVALARAAKAAGGDDWVALADWLAEWSVGEAHGGQPQNAEGWMLRGEIASGRGNLTAANQFFRQALENASPEQQRRLYYNLGKLAEMRGVLFSPRGEELDPRALESMDPAEVTRPAVGAYDYYKIALTLARVEADGKVGAPSFRDVLSQYDVHYALGRLAFLRFTTSSLAESAAHLRMCRRLARYRLLTSEALYASYTLEMLFDDVMRSHPNPCHAGARRDQSGVLVAVTGGRFEARAEIRAQNDLELDLRNAVYRSDEIRWLALESRWQPASSRLDAWLERQRDRSADLVARIRDSATAPLPEAARGEHDPSALLRDLARHFAPLFGAELAEGEWGLTDWLQNPLYWARSAIWAAADASGRDRPEAVDFRLSQLEEEADGHLVLTFAGASGERAVARCVPRFGRLALLSFEQTDGFRVRLQYGASTVGTGAGAERLESVEVFLPRREVGDGSFERTKAFDEAEEDIKIALGYRADQPLVIESVRVIDARVWRAQRDAGREVNRFHSELEGYWSESTRFETGRGSLASAYIPFHVSRAPDAYRDVSLADARWALLAGAPGAEVADCLLQEAARRATEASVRPSERMEARALLFDVVTGHFDAALSEPRVQRAAAASALASLDPALGEPDPTVAVYWRAGAKAVIRALRGLSEDSEVDLPVVEAATRWTLPLSPLERIPAIEKVRDESTTEVDRPHAEAMEREDEEIRRRLTESHYRALARLARYPETALPLARAVVRAGLAEQALEWLEAARALDGQHFELRSWLANRALPPDPETSHGVTTPRSSALRANQQLVAAMQKLYALAVKNEDAADADFVVPDGWWTAFGEAELATRRVRAVAARSRAAVGDAARLHLALLAAASSGLTETFEGQSPENARCARMASDAGALFADLLGLAAAAQTPEAWDQAVDTLWQRVETPFENEGAERPAGWGSFGPVLPAAAAPPSLEKSNGLAEFHGRSLAERRRVEAPPASVSSGTISVTETNAANFESWELVLHDEPYSDSCVALLALADRHLARDETESAEARLREALRTLTKLEQDLSEAVSEADRAQIESLARRVRTRLAWLGQGRDAYGRFLASAPPRRLDSILQQLGDSIRRYSALLDTQIQYIHAIDGHERERFITGLEHEETRRSLQSADRQIERANRVIAHLQSNLGVLRARRVEAHRMRDEGQAQLRRGKKLVDDAVESLGSLAMSAMVNYAAPASGLLDAETTKHVAKALQTAAEIRSGKDPLRAVMGTYGEDLIGLAFQGVDSDGFFAGHLEGVVKDAVGEYARTGRVELDQLGQRSLRRAGERLFDQSVDRLADEIERAIGTRAGDVAELARTWNGLVEEAEAALERPIETVRELRTLARRVQIDGEHRARLLTQILADAPLDDVLDGLHVEDLPLDRVWRRYRELEATGDDAVRTLATQATDHLIDAIVPPAVDEAVRSTWAELHHGLEGAGRASGLRDVYALLEGLAEAELDDEAVHQVWEGVRRSLALGAELEALFELPATRLLHADIAPLLDRPLLESFPALEDLRSAESTVALRDALSLLERAVETIANDRDIPLADRAKRLRSLARIAARVCRAALPQAEAVGRLPEELERRLGEHIATSFSALWPSDGSSRRTLGRAFLDRDATLERLMREMEAPRGRRALDDVGHAVRSVGALEPKKLLKGFAGDAQFVQSILPDLERSLGDGHARRNGILEAVLDAGLQGVADPLAAAGSNQPDGALGVKLGVSVVVGRERVRDPGRYARTLAATELMRGATPTADPDRREAVAGGLAGATAPSGVGATESSGPDIVTVETTELPAGRDELQELMGNPGIQAMVAGIGAAVPAVGIAVKAVSIVSNWLKGHKEQELGFDRVREATTRARELDREIQETRHQRDLAELELLEARDEARHQERRMRGLLALSNHDAHAENREVVLQRMTYQRVWAQLGLLSHQLYLVQRAFEYELDVPLEQAFERWPQLDALRPLLELSPGVLRGEFDRTSVHRDLTEHLSSVERIPDVIRVIDDIARGARLRDTITLSLRHDHPIAWNDLVVSGAARFRTEIGAFGGASVDGRPLRFGIKIESVRVEPRLGEPTSLEPSEQERDTSRPPRPQEMRRPREEAQRRRAATALELARAHENRFKFSLWHSGEGYQLDDQGRLRWLEWAPQVTDSNFGVQNPEVHYHPLEGLTPGADWVLRLDPRGELRPGQEIQDVLVHVSVTFSRATTAPDPLLGVSHAR